jgi:hypothetical protein
MPDRPSPTSSDLLKRTAWYAAAVGATAGVAQAQVTYVDLDSLGVFDTYLPDADGDGEPDFAGIPFDLDGDGDSEIIFAHRNGPVTDYSLAYSDFPEAFPEGDFLSNIVGQLRTFDGLSYPYFAPLSAGYVLPGDVGAANDFFDPFIYQGTFTFAGASPLNLFGGDETYIGLEFVLNDVDVHYAWMRIERLEHEDSEEGPREVGGFIIREYAYNTTPGGSVEVGSAKPVAAEERPEAQGLVSLVGANPFGAAGARLRVVSPSAEHVRAEVFDALGRQVAVLHDGRLVNARTFAFGADLAPGLYVVRVTGETFRQTLKVTRR